MTDKKVNIYYTKEELHGFKAFEKRLDSFAVGNQGEKVFNSLLEKNGFYDFPNNTQWVSDISFEHDFIVNGKTIDVKTIDADYKILFLIPAAQGCNSDYYVSVTLPNTINGWLNKAQVLKLPIDQKMPHKPALYSTIYELNPINELLDILRDKT